MDTSQNYYGNSSFKSTLTECVCVCTCMRACVCACACMCVWYLGTAMIVSYDIIKRKMVLVLIIIDTTHIHTQ